MKNLIFFIFEKSYSKKLGFVLRTDKAFNSIFSFVKEDGLTFLCLKEKLQKKQTSLGGLSACRPSIVSQQRSELRWSFSASESTVPQNSTSATLKAKRLGIVGSRIGGFDLMGGCVWEPHHANHGTLPCAVTRSTIRGSFRLYGSRWVPPQICGHSRIMI